jgi:GMP synthase (glutamine-hydrolysing)
MVNSADFRQRARQMRVLLLKAGDAANAVRVAHGDYERWFIQAIGRAGVQFDVALAHVGQRLPRARDYQAVIMTGSPHSVTAPTAWMREAGAWLRDAGERGTAVLGVCFGHQLLAHAYGTRVIRNPKGRELGTVEVPLSAAGRRDPLFAGLPATLTVQATHEDIVSALPASATLLAGNDACAVQAFAIGPRIRAIQFHPEVQPAAMLALIRSRAGQLPPERLRTLLSGVRPTPHGARILKNFLDSFAGRGAYLSRRRAQPYNEALSEHA